jgi:D-cysteine desulfhydrase
MISIQQLRIPPRFKLARLPTPLEELPNLPRKLGGPRLLVKRDDLTGLATGGNKSRKLEFLIADARAQGADCIITAGGPQSNHCRQTAAAAAIAGLGCHLVLGGEPQAPIGNLLLDELLGARVHWTAKPHRNARMASLAAELEAAGRSPYIIPVGGSNAIGAIGYVLAMYELVAQTAEQGVAIDRIVFATSSGGTQAGMVLGAALAGFKGRLTAISIDQPPDHQSDEKFLAEVCRIANCTAVLLETDVRLGVGDLDTNYEYMGGGYGVVGHLERDAIRLVASSDGLLLGPVYTGRAAGGMIDLIRRGAISADETVLFWHTGDEAALHAYGRELLAEPKGGM